jgi:hypothetical protein
MELLTASKSCLGEGYFDTALSAKFLDEEDKYGTFSNTLYAY